MTLNELALQYRESSRACRERAMELRATLPALTESCGETMALRRRISMLESMAKETMALAKYMENYYRRPESDGTGHEKNENGAGDRGAELEALRKAIREAGKRRRNSNRRGA